MVSPTRNCDRTGIALNPAFGQLVDGSPMAPRTRIGRSDGTVPIGSNRTRTCCSAADADSASSYLGKCWSWRRQPTQRVVQDGHRFWTAVKSYLSLGFPILGACSDVLRTSHCRLTDSCRGIVAFRTGDRHLPAWDVDGQIQQIGFSHGAQD